MYSLEEKLIIMFFFFDKNREMEKIKNKKYIKNEDIWDFLHDV